MRSSIDLPPELLHAAEARAAERGERLDELVARAIAREVGLLGDEREGERLVLPLIGRGDEPTINLTKDDIEAIFEAEDVERAMITPPDE